MAKNINSRRKTNGHKSNTKHKKKNDKKGMKKKSTQSLTIMILLYNFSSTGCKNTSTNTKNITCILLQCKYKYIISACSQDLAHVIFFCKNEKKNNTKSSTHPH